MADWGARELWENRSNGWDGGGLEGEREEGILEVVGTQY